MRVGGGGVNVSHSHAEPVPLGALEPVGEFKAVHLQQVEEGVPHHVGYAVSSLQQTAAEPAHSQEKPLSLPGQDLLEATDAYFWSQPQ